MLWHSGKSVQRLTPDPVLQPVRSGMAARSHVYKDPKIVRSGFFGLEGVDGSQQGS